MLDPVEKRLTLGEHLEELRSRVIRSLLGVAGGFTLCYAFIDKLMWVVLRPYKAAMASIDSTGTRPLALRPAESFMNYLKIAFIGGLFLAGPFILYQMWQFISAGLYKTERRAVLAYLPLSIFLFLVGCVFGYAFLVPAALEFLVGFGKETIETHLTIGDYLDFFFLFTLLTGLSFELPMIMTFFAKIGMVTPQAYRRQWKVAILLAFVLAAILTPSPDPVTQTVLAVPLYILYEGGILLSIWAQKKAPPPPTGATP